MEVLRLSQICLFLNNPRLSSSKTQDEALIKIVDDQGEKLYKLAQDIVRFGLSDLDVIAVFPGDNGTYFVAEGNRRISALKILQAPEIVKDKFPALFKRFKMLSEGANLDFDKINVSIFKSEKDERLIHFLQVRHLGEQEGVGTVKWDSMQKDRFDNRIFGKENLSVFLDGLEENGYLTKKQVYGVTKTNWDRILRPMGLDFLHLKKENGTYKIEDGFEKEFSIKIKLVADELYKKTVKVVYDKESIENFFNEINEKFTGESKKDALPAAKVVKNDGEPKKSFKKIPGYFSTFEESADTITINKQESSQPDCETKTIKRMPVDEFKNIKTVIPKLYRLQSRNHRVSMIINELKELSVEQYPNACGCLLRALIELCAKEYISYHELPLGNKATVTDYEFQEAITYARNDMVKTHLITKEESKTIGKETEDGGVRQLFNGYMHNTEEYPSPIVIQGVFQTYSKFLKNCLL